MFIYGIHANDPPRRCPGTGRHAVLPDLVEHHQERPSKTGPPVHDDLVDRDFEVDCLDALWLTDITAHPTGEGKLYVYAGALP